MEMYIDKLPKDCWNCPCFRDNIDFPCGLGDGVKDYYLDEIDGGECPLKSLAEHDKQVRKKLIGDLKEELKRNGRCSIRKIGTMDFLIEMDKLNEILDESEGEQNGSKN